MNTRLNNTLISVALVTLLAGCASHSATESDFGNSVRDMILNQTHDVGATLESEPEPVVGADPYQLENVINAHRERSSQKQ